MVLKAVSGRPHSHVMLSFLKFKYLSFYFVESLLFFLLTQQCFLLHRCLWQSCNTLDVTNICNIAGIKFVFIDCLKVVSSKPDMLGQSRRLVLAIVSLHFQQPPEDDWIPVFACGFNPSSRLTSLLTLTFTSALRRNWSTVILRLWIPHQQLPGI